VTEISAIIPTWRRPESLVRALKEIFACQPAPTEVLVHVDAGDNQTERIVRPQVSEVVRWFSSMTTQGPGGGRNRLLREAKCPLVASFDDDSWPLDRDYFSVAAGLFDLYPDAAVLTGQEVRPGASPSARDGMSRSVACFHNAICLMRREAFLGTRGYLPLRYAYGMEEADVALQLLDAGWNLLEVSALRVYHDSHLAHQNGKTINAAFIRNTALLVYLRYPIRYWFLGALQVLNRAHYALRRGRWRGILEGFGQIPGALWGYRKQRRPVSSATIALSRSLARGKASPVLSHNRATKEDPTTIGEIPRNEH
jgi:GT2 family glycosyltransferase